MLLCVAVRAEKRPVVSLGCRKGYIGLGKNGQIYLAPERGNTQLIKYELQQDKTQLKTVHEWPKSDAVNFAAGCRKYVCANGELLVQNEYRSRIKLYDEKMKRIQTWRNHGILIGYSSPSFPVYKEFFS